MIFRYRSVVVHHESNKTWSLLQISFHIYVELIVMPRSLSSSLVSVNLVSPALELAMRPALAIRESVNVDLPWSTWAMTDILRILWRLSITLRILSIVRYLAWKIRQNNNLTTCLVEKVISLFCNTLSFYYYVSNFEIGPKFCWMRSKKCLL